jgi:phosphoketolase
MIFLTMAPLEKEKFTQDIVKKRLLGHFGAPSSAH